MIGKEKKVVSPYTSDEKPKNKIATIITIKMKPIIRRKLNASKLPPSPLYLLTKSSATFLNASSYFFNLIFSTDLLAILVKEN